MAKKPQKYRTGIRSATKTQEKQIVQNAKKILEDPLIALPKCLNPKCKGLLGKCYFKTEFKEIEKIRSIKNDEKKITRHTKGDNLVSAIAGTLLIAHSQKAPYLAVAKLPHGTVPYAKRGDANWEKLIGVQHFTDPQLRLLSVGEKAVKKGLHIYSTNDAMFCTGNEAHPPVEFIQFVSKKLGLNNDYTCKHLNKKIVKEKKTIQQPYIRIKWISGKKIIGVCKECSQGNTLTRLKQYFYSPDDEFQVEVVSREIECISNCPKCKIKPRMDENIDTLPYIEGKMSDNAFIEYYKNESKKQIEKLDEKIIIMDDKCYGDDTTRFIEDLNPTKWEKLGLEYILNKITAPLIIPRITPNKILEKYWEEYGKEILKKLVQDEVQVQEILTMSALPSEMLEKALNMSEKKEILSNLPRYENLPPLAGLADAIARAYKTLGKKEAIKIISSAGNKIKDKSVAYSFLLAMDQGQDLSWKYSPVEKELGQHLQVYAKKLLNAQSQNYHDALQELIFATGSTEKIKR